ncbi:MAG TPA: transposase [Rhodoferax sp.]|jgi:hypothetical protein|nr:transposase [Rhodoferax sp.]HPW30467.1 transposase [Rhodoferax sp.]
MCANSYQFRSFWRIQPTRIRLRVGIHRFGSSLNAHVHFHVCVVDGVFEEVAGEGDADAAPQMRIIAFITHSADIRHILNHIGVESEPPHIAPARGPPLWDDCDAQVGEGADGEPDWDMAAQPAPDYEVDQSVNW